MTFVMNGVQATGTAFIEMALHPADSAKHSFHAGKNFMHQLRI